MGVLSERPRAPEVDRKNKVMTIFFPLSPRLAYVVAAVYGDGSVSKRRLTYFNMDRRWIETLATELRRLTESGGPKPQVLPCGWRGCYSIEYCNSALARAIGGDTAGRLWTVDFLTHDRKTLAAFSAGLLDTEGSATLYVNRSHRHGTPEISIANSNVGMLCILQRRLRRYGIEGGISLAAAPRTTMIEGRKVRWKKRVYRLRFSGWASAMDFGKFVLPWAKSQAKRNRIREIIASGAGRI